MRLSRIALLFAPWLLAAPAHGQDKGPLEMHVTAKRTSFVTAKDADKPNFVAIQMELKNVSKEKLQLLLAPEPHLALTGPRPESVRKTGGHTYYTPQEEFLALEPGQTHRINLRTLSYRANTSQFHVAWTEPGDYMLQMTYAICVSPRPVGSVPGRFDAFVPNKIAADDKFGIITLKSAPIKLTVAEGSVIDYWTEAVKDADIDVRRIALMNLKDMGVAAIPAARTIVAALTDADADVRLKAVQTLEKLGPKVKDVALPGLLQTLRDGDKPIRLASISALVHVAPAEKIVGVTLLALLTDRDKDVRIAAARAWYDIPFLGRRVEASDTTALLAALKNETDSVVRRGIVTALGHHARPEVLQAFLPLIESDDKYTRHDTVHALGRLVPFLDRDKKRDAEQGHPIQQTVAALIRTLKDQELLPATIYALARFGPDAASAVPALVQVLEDPQNQGERVFDSPRVAVVQALRDIGPGAKSATRVLAMRLLTDPSWSVRQYAAQALGEIRADPAIAGAALNQAFKDKMVQVRNEVAPALAKIGAIDALLDGLVDENPETRASIIHALAGMKDKAKQVVPALVKELHDDAHAPNRRHAAAALGSLGAVDAVPDLAKSLTDKDDQVRQAAVDALRSMGLGAKAAVVPLIDLVKSDKSRQNREKACWALVAIDVKGHKSLVPTLVEMLTERDAEFVMPAIYLAGQIGPDAAPALDHLRRLAQRKDYHGAAAREALRKIEAPR